MENQLTFKEKRNPNASDDWRKAKVLAEETEGYFLSENYNYFYISKDDIIIKN